MSKDDTPEVTLPQVLANDFGVPEEKVESLIDAIPTLAYGMRFLAEMDNRLAETVSIADLLTSGILTEDEKNIFKELTKEQIDAVSEFMNTIPDLIGFAIPLSDAFDWSKSGVEFPEDTAVSGAVIALLDNILPRRWKQLNDAVKVALDTAERQSRIMYDSIDVDIVKDSIKIDEKTGIMTGTAVMTSAMVQEYKDDSGKTRKILKCPDELRKIPMSCRQIPITDQHPDDRMVNDPAQIKGWTGVPVYDEESKNLVAPIEIGGANYDAAELIKKIQDGKTDNSIGFICELDETPGVFTDAGGKKHDYDAKQVKMILNHLAAGLDKGRGRCPDGVCGITKQDCRGCKPECENRKEKPAEEEKDGDNEIQAAQKTPQTGGKCTCLKCGGSFPPDKGLECSETQCPTCTGKGMEKKSQDPTTSDTDEATFNDSDLVDIDAVLADIIYRLYDVEDDARLTATQRNELPVDVFCGPNRSFPVNDCAHYIAAKTLLGRYKGEGSKSDIADCIEKRGKALNCPGATEGEEDEMAAGKYMLEEAQGHTHTVTIDDEGKGTSSTENDHSHKIEDGKVAFVNGHFHKLKAVDEDEDPEPEVEEVVTEEEGSTEVEGADMELHKKLVKEKIEAMKVVTEKMQTETDPNKLKALSSQLSNLNGYEFRETTLVALGAKDEKKAEDKDDSMDKKDEDPVTEEEVKDARKEIDEAYRALLDNKTRMVDRLMDFNPPHDRDHYMTMKIDQLKELYHATVSGEKSPASTSDSSAKAKDVDDAYAVAQEKLDRM